MMLARPDGAVDWLADYPPDGGSSRPSSHASI